jgi:uncharacterized membrane protein YoaK (UPF0700 family)
MDRAERLLVSTLLALTFTTGLVDAVSFLGLGQIFTSNTTGMLVILGFAIAGAPGLSIAASLVSIGSFLTGAVGGGRLFPQRDDPVRRRRWLLRAMAFEVTLMTAAAIAAIGVAAGEDDWRRYLLIVLMASAMGLRTATMRHLAERDMPTTVVTLAMAGLASESQLAGGSGERLGRRVGAITSMLAGAVFGALLVLHNDLVVPLGAMAILVAGTAGAYAYASAPSRSRATSPE